MRTVILGLAVACAASLVSVAGVSANSLNIDGYLQARIESTSRNSDYRALGNRAVGKTQFTIPRARIRANYTGTKVSGVVEVDGAGDGNILRDAYIQIPLNVYGEKPVTATIGQFKVPFGYAVPESSAVREFPERPVGFDDTLNYVAPVGGAVGLPFVNIRDKGVQLSYGMGALQFDAAVVNGNGIANGDNNNGKDIYGRIGYGTGPLNVAGSIRVGENGGVVDNLYGIGAVLEVPTIGGKLTGEFAQGRTNTLKPKAWYLQYFYPATGQIRVGARYAVADGGEGDKIKVPGVAVVYDASQDLRYTVAVETPKFTGVKSYTQATLQAQVAY